MRARRRVEVGATRSGRATAVLGGAGFDAPCPAHGDDAVVDRSSWLSTHRTSAGTVVYYRCRCGQPSLAVLASTWRP